MLDHFFSEIAIWKSLKNNEKKVQRSTLLRSADRPEVEFKVACDVTRPDKSSGLVTSQGTLNPISGRSADRRRVLLWTFFSLFFKLFQMAISEKKWSSIPLASPYGPFYGERIFILRLIRLAWWRIICFKWNWHLNNTHPTAFLLVLYLSVPTIPFKRSTSTALNADDVH